MMPRKQRTKLDFHELSSQLQPYIEAIVAAELPGGKREGREWTALNPTRADGRPGSFKVNLATGIWSDFATGEKGGNIISLVAYVRKCSQNEAAVMLDEQYIGSGMTPRSTAENEKGKRMHWEPVIPAPEDAPPPPKAHYHYGAPARWWEYRDGVGKLLGYVCRFDRSDRDKIVLPLVCCRNLKGRLEWRWHAFPVPRPLYGLGALAAKPHSAVLVVEGEKCADAGARLIGDRFVVVSWPGGSKATAKINWTPLYGRDVYLWPDRDRTGYLAMLDIAACLECHGTHAVIIRPPDGKPKGWDIADAIDEGWTAERIIGHMNNSRMRVDDCRRAHEEQNDEKTRAERTDAPFCEDSGGNSDNVSEAGNAISPSFHFTDTGNAQRLIASYGSMIRYNDDPFSKWFIWDGRRWCEDRTNRIYYYVDRVVTDLYHEAADCCLPFRRRSLSEWAFKLENMQRQKAMVAKAETLQEIVITADNLDRDLYLFNTESCTVDLSSGEPVPREHRQGDYITKIAPVSFDAGARCPRWEAFLDEIFEGNGELISFVRRAVGYSLTGDVSAQCFFFAYGTGMNGKSVFFNLLQILLGDYWGKAPTDMIMQQQYSQVPTDVADLRGLRFVVCSELADNRRFSEERLKDLTGEDQVKARRMRENYFDFKPTHKLWMYGNHKPQIQGTDPGIWRRVRIIPFTVRIPDDRRVPMNMLLDGFRAELSGILNWALTGLTEYMERGLGEPDIVMAATEEYRREMDIVGRFIEENCLKGGEYQIQVSKIWKAYHGWCDDIGEHAMSGRRFNQRLREMGYELKIGHANKTFVYGFTLNQEAESELLNSLT